MKTDIFGRVNPKVIKVIPRNKYYPDFVIRLAKYSSITFGEV